MNEARLLRSANYVRQELVVRLVHRLKGFQNLPYCAAMEPHIRAVYDRYWSGFNTLQQIPEIKDLSDNQAFCVEIQRLLHEHLVVIPQLVAGSRECVANKMITADEMDVFLMGNLRSRVSRRVLAEQHLALTTQLNTKVDPQTTKIGIVDTAASALEIVQRAIITARQMTEAELDITAAPNVEVTMPKEGDVKLACIPTHIEYALHELLRNATKFTALRHKNMRDKPDDVVLTTNAKDFPAIVLTITKSQADIVFRVTDQAGGFDNYGILSDGLGLLMARVYTEYWGGTLRIKALPGWGSDAYLCHGLLGNRFENLGE